MDLLDKGLKYIEITLASLAGLLLLCIVVSIWMSIALRMLNIQVPLWSVQFSEYSLLWITFLGGPWLLRKNQHVSVDIITRRLGIHKLSIVHIIHGLLGLIICGVLAWYSGVIVLNDFRRGIMDTRAVDVPEYLILSAIFAGFLLLAIEFLRGLFVTIERQRKRD